MRVRLVIITCLFWAGYALPMLSIPRSGNAAEWSALPSIRVGQEYNDNLQLIVQPHNSVNGSMIAPKLDLAAISDIWRVTGEAEAVQKRFSGESDLNRDDRFYNLGASYTTERSTWQLTGSSTKSSILANELASPDIGVVGVQKIQDAHSLNPSLTWAMNELTQLQIGYSYNNVSYVDGKSVGFNDYTTRAISAQLSNQLDPNDQISFSAWYSIFTVPSTTFESKSAMYQAGIVRTFSETMSGTLLAGWRNNSNEQIVLICSVSNPFYPFLGPPCLQTAQETIFSRTSSSVYNGILDKKFETTHLKITFSRAFDPSGLGGQVRSDSQQIWLGRDFTSKLNGYISVANYGFKSETGNLPGVDRHLYTIEPGLHWTWTEKLGTDLSYQYWHIKRADEDKPATSKSIYLTLRYEWPKMSFSR